MFNFAAKFRSFFSRKAYSLPQVYTRISRLVTIILVFNLLVFLCFGYGLFASSKSYIAQFTGVIHQNVSSIIETRISESIRILKFIAFMDASRADGFSMDMQDGYLAYLANQYGFSHIAFCDTNGICTSTYGKETLEMSDTTYLREAMNSQTPRVAPINSSLFTQKSSINIYVPVLDDHKHAQGALVGVINLKHFVQSFRDVIQLQHVDIILLDDHYTVLFDSMHEGDAQALNSRSFECIVHNQANVPHFVFEEGRVYMHVHAMIPRINWTLVIKINTFGLFGDIFMMQIAVLGALLFMTLLAGFVLSKLAHGIVTPIDSLVNSVQKMHDDEPENDDIVQFITTAMQCTKNILQSKEFFYSIDRKTNKVELSFGDFQLMTGFTLPRTAHEIDTLFLENILPNDKESYEYAISIYEKHMHDKEHTYATSFWMRTKDNRTICISYTITNLYEDCAWANSMIRLNDITEQQEREATLKKRAQIDAATGIYNKKSFEDIAQQIIESTFADQRSTLALIDIDNFKSINDTCGHAEGDTIIKAVADLLIAHSRNTDRVGRIGGDEFAVLFVGLMQDNDIANKISSIISQFSAHIETENLPASCSLSIGLATLEAGQSFNQLFRHADTALYCAKRAGKGRYCCYDPSLDVKAAHEKALAETARSGE